MENQRKRDRHSVILILALLSLISVFALLMAPSRNVSAQATASWSYTGNLNSHHQYQTATLLQNGKVLVAGGMSTFPAAGGIPILNTELYDPSTGTWSITGNLHLGRRGHTATLLPNGKVLVAGGETFVTTNGITNSAELYDPATGTWSSTGNLNTERADHTATLLPNGKVLIVGGRNFSIYSNASAEIYDPATGTWSSTGPLNTGRSYHTATLLPNGTVLVAGGYFNGNGLNSAELYQPATGTWSNTGNLNTGRDSHGATLLQNGKVLVVGGNDVNAASKSAELYDATSGTWSTTGSLNAAHNADVLTPILLPSGKVLLAGIRYDDDDIAFQASELYEPATGSWSITANPNHFHFGGTDTLLPNGQVLKAGGDGGTAFSGNTAELYDPGPDSTPTPTPTPTSTPTAIPTPTPTATPTATPTPTGPTWTSTGNLNTGRDSQTATLLPNGKVLVVGGNDGNGTLKSVELYDSATGTWANTNSLNTSSAFHTATLLPNGKVLVAGGFTCAPPPQMCASLNGAQLYDPSTGIWTNTGNLNAARDGHVAVLLQNGKVLVIGGDSVGNGAELYDPATGTWSLTGNLNLGRRVFTATLLKNGKVLVAGGSDDNRTNALSSAELYDPATGIWSNTANLITARGDHTANLLPNGNVLVVGGFVDYQSGQVTNSAELYDPGTGTWSNTGTLNRGRTVHTTTLLMTGKVLVAGGFFIDGLPNITDGCELYDPATGTWSNTASLKVHRRFHTATLLLNGKVLAAGGTGFSDSGINAANSAELYDPGLNPIEYAQFFIRQQYLDFLNREPEQEGLQFYLDILNGCQPSDTECIKYTRGALSANFFRSPEFQQKGSYVANLYNITLGQRPKTVAELTDATKVERPHYAEFITDLATLSVPTDSETNARKDQLATDWLNRPEIQQILPGTLTNQQFVQKVETIAGISLANESMLIANLNNATQTRAQVLRAIAESPEVTTKFYIQNFVTMEYFGYLRRDPEDCHGSLDPANCGYIFHNNRFNTPGADPDLIENIIVRGFIESAEYRQRFGTP